MYHLTQLIIFDYASCDYFMWLIIIPFHVATIASIQITNSKTFLCAERKEIAQSCPTVCSPMDWVAACQAPLSMEFSRQEDWEWVAIPFARGSSQPRD